MATRSVWRLAVVFLLLSACSEEETGLFPPVFPSHQEGPSWSSDGWIAYEDHGITCVSPYGVYFTEDSLRGIWIINPESGEKRRILSSGRSPAWSRDSRMLAFVTGGNQIAILNPETGQVRVVTPGDSFFPSWSPDGTRLAYDSITSGIWITNAEGTVRNRIFSPGRMPDWNPLTDQILHVRYQQQGRSLDLMSIFGTDSVRIAASSTELLYPRFSPDGTRIAYTLLSGLPQIWVMNADGSSPRRLTSRGGEWPSWSPDGREIVYASVDWRTKRATNGVLWIINVDSLDERQLTHHWPEVCQNLSSVH